MKKILLAAVMTGLAARIANAATAKICVKFQEWRCCSERPFCPSNKSDGGVCWCNNAGTWTRGYCFWGDVCANKQPTDGLDECQRKCPGMCGM
ncbi:MAG: hypothetical protein LBB08_02820 [Rickettsiales bacterium]|nr:hypothetical protein [Rickettsiales bacterium]